MTNSIDDIAEIVYEIAMRELSDFKEHWPKFSDLPVDTKAYELAFKASYAILELVRKNHA